MGLEISNRYHIFFHSIPVKPDDKYPGTMRVCVAGGRGMGVGGGGGQGPLHSLANCQIFKR